EAHHRIELNELIAAALHRGSAYQEVEEGLHYFIEAPLPGTDASLDKFNDVLSSFSEQPFVVFVNRLKQHNIAYYPFALSITDPESLLKFYNGDFLITVCVDIGFVRSHLKLHGLSLECAISGMFLLKIHNDTPNESQLQELGVSDHFWGRLFAE